MTAVSDAYYWATAVGAIGVAWALAFCLWAMLQRLNRMDELDDRNAQRAHETINRAGHE